MQPNNDCQWLSSWSVSEPGVGCTLAKSVEQIWGKCGVQTFSRGLRGRYFFVPWGPATELCRDNLHGCVCFEERQRSACCVCWCVDSGGGGRTGGVLHAAGGHAPGLSQDRCAAAAHSVSAAAELGWGSRLTANFATTCRVLGLPVSLAAPEPRRSLPGQRGLIRLSVSDRRTLSNPSRGVSLPRKVKKPHVYLGHEQVHALAAASKYPALVLVLAYCGIRWGEATALRVKHLDMLRRRLMIEENAVQVGSVIEVGTPKNHKKRTVPFPRFLGEYLARQCAGKGRDDLVFPGESGHHLHLARVHEDNMSWFGSAVKRTGIPRITPHDLRHSAASFAVSAGANVKAVQKMLGHSSVP